jgi:hypothetical protein
MKKIRGVGADMSHPRGQRTDGDRLTDLTKPIVALRNFAIALKRDKPFILSLSAADYLIFCKTNLQDSQKAIVSCEQQLIRVI